MTLHPTDLTEEEDEALETEIDEFMDLDESWDRESARDYILEEWSKLKAQGKPYLPF